MRGFVVVLLPFIFLVVVSEARNPRLSEDILREDANAPKLAYDFHRPHETPEKSSKAKLFPKGGNKMYEQAKAKPYKHPRPYNPLAPKFPVNFKDFYLDYDHPLDYSDPFSPENKRDEVTYDDDFDGQDEFVRGENLGENYDMGDPSAFMRFDEEDDNIQPRFDEESDKSFFSEEIPREEEQIDQYVSQDELREEILRAVLQTDTDIGTRRNMRAHKFLNRNLKLSELTKQDAILKKVLEDDRKGRSDEELRKLREKLLREELLKMEAEERAKYRNVLQMIL